MDAPAGFAAASDTADTATLEFGNVTSDDGTLLRLASCHHYYTYDAEGHVTSQRVFDGTDYYVRSLRPEVTPFHKNNP